MTGAIVIFFNTNGCNSISNINVSCPEPNPISGPSPNSINTEAPCSDCVPPTLGSVVAVFPNPTFRQAEHTIQRNGRKKGRWK
ncbi:MAG: hypothetical protein R2788_01395 [Saprospiraceae bacterium]